MVIINLVRGLALIVSFQSGHCWGDRESFSCLPLLSQATRTNIRTFIYIMVGFYYFRCAVQSWTQYGLRNQQMLAQDTMKFTNCFNLVLCHTKILGGKISHGDC